MLLQIKVRSLTNRILFSFGIVYLNVRVCSANKTILQPRKMYRMVLDLENQLCVRNNLAPTVGAFAVMLPSMMKRRILLLYVMAVIVMYICHVLE